MSQNKKPKGLLIVLITEIVLIVIGAVALIIVLISRSKSNTADNPSVQEEEEIAQEPAEVLTQEALAALSPEEGAKAAVEAFLTCYQQCDPRAAEYASGMDGLSFPAIQAKIARGMTFILGETRMTTDETGFEYALVPVTIEAPSFASAYEEAMKQVSADASEEEILKAVEEQLGKEAEKQTFNIEIPVFDFIDSRQVQMTSDLSDAITGGLISYMAQQMEGGEGHE